MPHSIDRLIARTNQQRQRAMQMTVRTIGQIQICCQDQLRMSSGDLSIAMQSWRADLGHVAYVQYRSRTVDVRTRIYRLEMDK
jgi:hypothetical protein